MYDVGYIYVLCMMYLYITYLYITNANFISFMPIRKAWPSLRRCPQNPQTVPQQYTQSPYTNFQRLRLINVGVFKSYPSTAGAVPSQHTDTYTLGRTPSGRWMDVGHPRRRRDSNPQSQEASGHRPTPEAARPPGSTNVETMDRNPLSMALNAPILRNPNLLSDFT